MRYIDTTNLYKKAQKWVAKDLWKDKQLKADFKQYFFDKCWYTECSISGNDVQIDHFRPKAAIKPFQSYNYNTILANQGYDWLKNDYKNYRACCIFANRKTGSGGKGNFFPLQTGSPLAQNGQLNGEIAMLLDPTVKGDPDLLLFMKNTIRCTSNDSYLQDRVSVSSIIYNLIDPGLTQKRLRKWDITEKYIDDYCANKIGEDYLLDLLTREISRESEFSAVAICCVKCRKADIPPSVYNQLNLVL